MKIKDTPNHTLPEINTIFLHCTEAHKMIHEVNIHKHIRLIADILFDLSLMLKTVKYRWGQLPEANYSLGMSPLCVCWVLNLKTIIILSAQ